jgi:hypothetical protein
MFTIFFAFNEAFASNRAYIYVIKTIGRLLLPGKKIKLRKNTGLTIS